MIIFNANTFPGGWSQAGVIQMRKDEGPVLCAQEHFCGWGCCLVHSELHGSSKIHFRTPLALPATAVIILYILGYFFLIVCRHHNSFMVS